MGGGGGGSHGIEWVGKGRNIFVNKTFSSLLVYVFPNEAYRAIIDDRINRIIPSPFLL